MLITSKVNYVEMVCTVCLLLL